MSKSGLFAHFGSKEELQLAAVEAAARRFAHHVVIAPSRELPPGRARVERVFDGWLDYYRANIFQGGCFFSATRTEFESRPDTAVRTALVEQKGSWHRFLKREIREAQEAGGIDASADPAQVESISTRWAPWSTTTSSSCAARGRSSGRAGPRGRGSTR